jgi:ABC-type ATPase involved in cell division
VRTLDCFFHALEGPFFTVAWTPRTPNSPFLQHTAGQNAAGKSTLINCLSGLLAPTHGEAFLFGNSIREDVSILRDRMGTCPQHVRLG